MEKFKKMSLVEFAARYKDHEEELAGDLMAARLICSTPPVCHGAMRLYCYRGWYWRCEHRQCCKMEKIIKDSGFLAVFLSFFAYFAMSLRGKKRITVYL